MQQRRSQFYLAKQNGNQTLVDRIEQLGSNLQKCFNQDQDGEEPRKPPPECSHPTVIITLTEHRQMETDISAGREAITLKPHS